MNVCTQSRCESTSVQSDDEHAVHLVARLGRLLMTAGADTAHAVSHMREISVVLGYESHILATSEAIMVTLERDGRSVTKVGKGMPATGADMARLTSITRFIADSRGATLDAHALDAAMDRIEAQARYPDIVVALGLALTAASLARLFGAEPVVVVASAVAALLGSMVRLYLTRIHANGLVLAGVTALVSGLIGSFIMQWMPQASPVLCLTAVGMILVPGVPLINAIRDFVTGHVSNALTRSALGLATVGVIGLALLAASVLAGNALPVGLAPQSISLVEDVVFSASAAIGYALLFNVPARSIWLCVVCGMLSHGSRSALEFAGMGLVSASLVGGIVAGGLARASAFFTRSPAVVFAFAGIVAMVPGSYGFRAAIGSLHIMHQGAVASASLVAQTASLLLTTGMVTIAIAVGLSLALAKPGAGFLNHVTETHHHDQDQGNA